MLTDCKPSTPSAACPHQRHHRQKTHSTALFFQHLSQSPPPRSPLLLPLQYPEPTRGLGTSQAPSSPAHRCTPTTLWHGIQAVSHSERVDQTPSFLLYS